MKPSLCLNMIVKNEAARIERCLASVLPYVKSVMILDTGSTDDTIKIIERTCAAARVPCVVSQGQFVNFSQARNDAFELARRYRGGNEPGFPHVQFALLVDADMELTVTDKHAFHDLNATAGSYDMMQKGGTLSYANRRVINLSWPKKPYVGVTHEYIDVPAAGMIKGASFIDYADGANRVNKFARDALLLENDLDDDPKNVRSWYYLANTYRDMGSHAKAITAYTKRIELGGWDEETHSAMMHRADCRLKTGDTAGFVAGMLEAYSFRPQRIEPLHVLAKFYRERGNNHASLLFSKPALTTPKPNDVLFIDDYAYAHGARFEYSICGHYVDAERPRSAEVTNDLALDPTFPFRGTARQNLYWTTVPLAELAPSFAAKRLDTFQAPAGYTAMNPSIEQFGGRAICNIRCVNYTMDEQGRYLINGTNGEANGTNPIDTRNFIVELDADFNTYSPREIIWDRGPVKFDLVTGLEDVRLWRVGSQLHFNACVRELLSSGMPQQIMGKLTHDPSKFDLRVEDWRPISDGNQCEKNWMHRDEFNFVYRLGQVVHADHYPNIIQSETNIHVGDIAGSSQCIPFKGGHLCVVHEAIHGPNGKRTYWHRFAWMNQRGEPRRLSKPFVFFERQIEFCAGLAYHPNHNTLLISFGVRDAEAWVGSIAAEDVANMLGNFNEG